MREVFKILNKNKIPLLTFVTLFLSLIFILELIFLKSLKTIDTNSKNPKQNQTFNLSETTDYSTQVAETITLIFTGDVIPARSVNATMTKLNNFTYPFEKTADFLKQADLTIINLEAPLVDSCPVTETGMVFCGNKRFTEGLTFAGVDVATLANNHSTNYGKAGVEQTIDILSQNNIMVTGVHNIAYKEIKGVKFAFLGYNGVSPLDPEISNINKEEITRQISEAKKLSDFIIVMYHWGREYSPSPINDASIAPFDPVEIGRFTIDSGADIVVGNHPHWVQGYEIYKGKPIFYALGNFIFDQMWSYETSIGATLKVNLNGIKISSFSLHPVKIENYSQPVFLEGEEKDAILKKMNPLTIQ